MAGQIAGYGIRIGSDSNSGGGGPTVSTLSSNQIPRFDAATNTLVNSGFTINPITQAITGIASIETEGNVQSGVSAFKLGSAHSISSSGENIAFTNDITNTTFHPTWQTTDSTGNWSSIQRTPFGELSRNIDVQTVNTETISNPNFIFPDFTNNIRIYSIAVEAQTTITNVVATIQVNNIDYWISEPVTLTAGSIENIPIMPFIDLKSGTSYRIILMSIDGDVLLLGNTGGIPRLQATLRQWNDLPLATEDFVGGFHLNGTISISENVSITADNVDQYDQKLWLILGPPGIKTITVADDLPFTYFGVFVRSSTAVAIITRRQSGLISFNDRPNITYTSLQAAVLARVSNRRFFELSSNIRPVTPADGVVTGASVSGNVLTLTRTGALADITVNIPGTADGVVTGASVSGSVLTLTRTGALADITVNIPGTTDGVVTDASVSGNLLTLIRSGALADITVNLPTNGVSTFAALSDTPTEFGTAGQVPIVNATRVGLEFADLLPGWTPNTGINFPLQTDNRQWYNINLSRNTAITLPPSGIVSGWQAFIANNSIRATITVNGNFAGAVTSIAFMPGEGGVIIWDGTNFFQGAFRPSIKISDNEEWEGNPLLTQTTYTNSADSTSWNSGATINLSNNGNARNHITSRLVRYAGNSNYTINLESLTSSTLARTPINTDFSFANQSTFILTLDLDGNDELIRGTVVHTGSNPLRVNTGAVVTITRISENQYSVTGFSGFLS